VKSKLKMAKSFLLYCSFPCIDRRMPKKILSEKFTARKNKDDQENGG
jgi:hypothetical protein